MPSETSSEVLRRREEEVNYCYECGGPLWLEKDYLTCSICGQKICENCWREHIPRCMAVEWGLVKFETDPKTGEIIEIPEERPPKYSLGD